MPRTDVHDILNAQIPITSYQEQTQIVNFLDGETERIDELISVERRKIKLLKEYRLGRATGRYNLRTMINPSA